MIALEMNCREENKKREIQGHDYMNTQYDFCQSIILIRIYGHNSLGGDKS